MLALPRATLTHLISSCIIVSCLTSFNLAWSSSIFLVWFCFLFFGPVSSHVPSAAPLFHFSHTWDNCVCFVSVSSISLLACPRQFSSLSEAIPRLVLRSRPISQMLFTRCQSGAEEGRTGNAASSDRVWNHSVLPLVTLRGAYLHDQGRRAPARGARVC